MATFLKQPDDKDLVHVIVFGEQNLERIRVFGWSRFANWSGGRLCPLSGQRSADSIQQFPLPDRLGEISTDAVLLTTGSISGNAGGGQHHNGGPHQPGILVNIFGN